MHIKKLKPTTREIVLELKKIAGLEQRIQIGTIFRLRSSRELHIHNEVNESKSMIIKPSVKSESQVTPH